MDGESSRFRPYFIVNPQCAGISDRYTENSRIVNKHAHIPKKKLF